MGRQGLKLRWTHPALADLIEAQDHIAADNAGAARAVAQRVWDAADHLRSNPQIGRPGHVVGTREWVVARTPYLMVYRVQGDSIEILRLWHSRRNWQNEPTG